MLEPSRVQGLICNTNFPSLEVANNYYVFSKDTVNTFETYHDHLTTLEIIKAIPCIETQSVRDADQGEQLQKLTRHTV